MTGRKTGINRLGWQGKLTGLIILVLGAVLLIQVFYVVPYIKNREVEHEKSRQEEIAYSIVQELDTNLFQSRNKLIELSKRTEFRSMDFAAQQEILYMHAEGSIRFVSLYVMDADGWFVSADDMENFSEYTTRSYADMPYFTIPFEQGETYCQKARYYPIDNQLAVTITVPIESDAGERVGVLLGTLMLNDLVEMVADYPLEEGMVAIMVDKEGTVVAHSDIDLFALEEGPLSLNYIECPLVQAIVAGEKGGAIKYMHEAIPYYGSYTVLESNGWGVIVERPMSLVMAEASAISRRMLVLNGSVFAVALFLALIIARQIMAGERKLVKKLERSELNFRTVADFTYGWESWIDPDGRVSYVSPACERITGYKAVEFLGDSTLLEKIVHADDKALVANHMIEEFKSDGILSLDFRIITRSGEEKWISHVCQSVYSTGGKWIGRRSSNRDITESKQDEAMIWQSLSDREMMLREIHHRVKNNMQVISSILRLQSRQIEDEQLRAMFGESQERIQAIALIHEKLYQSSTLAGIYFGEYLSSLVKHLSTAYGVNQDKVKIEIDAEDILLDIATAMPCALIVNELVSNSFKYAFPGGREGKLRVNLNHHGDNELVLMVSDDGIGFPEKDFHNQKKMGFQLVNTLVAQFGGNIELDSDGGTRFRIVFKQQNLQRERQE